MPARAAWKGFLHVSRLAVPVRAFSACRTTPEIPLRQLHRGCGERVREQRVCPVHGAVTSEEIVSGFEHEQGQYLMLDDDELAGLHPEDQKAIAVDCFVSQTEIDAVYHSGRTYYLVPDGPPGQRPFCVLREGMRQSERHAVARVVMAGREKLTLVRPLGRLLAMTVLEYPQRLRPADDYETEVAGISPGAAEAEMVGELIEAMTERELDLARYRDGYTDGLSRLIEQRLAEASQAIVDEQDDEAALVAALRSSLAAAVVEGAATRRSAPSRPLDDVAQRKSG
ncbi:MAG: hypothetical protein KY476_12420 [Planctomycetes bacterium]|nr:hypothetical protein [Planctomycetota bacterium]